MSRAALITGGAQGLGAAAAKRLLKDGFTDILLLDRNAERLAREAATLAKLVNIKTLVCDLADAATPAKAIAKCVQEFGRIDLLFNAAGSTARGAISDVNSSTYESLFNVNVRAPLFLMQEAAKVMQRQKSGTIINVSSMIAYGGIPSLAAYSASKAALNALSKHAAQEFAWDGIRTFVIALGWALTEGEIAVQAALGMPADWAQSNGAEMPSGRLISPEDIADLVAYLCSPSAQMMNGAVIDFEQMPQGMFRQHPALKSSA